MYYWVWTTYKGRPVLFKPPYSTEEEAANYGFSKLGNSFEVIPLNTRDMTKATHAIKRLIFERTSNLDTAMQRARHKLDERETR